MREKGVLSLPDAIRRMTSLPASRLRLADRGRIAPGLRADLTLFRPDQIVDVATFAAPHQYPSGIEYVFVNGALTIDRGRAYRRAGRPRAPPPDLGTLSRIAATASRDDRVGFDLHQHIEHRSTR